MPRSARAEPDEARPDPAEIAAAKEIWSGAETSGSTWASYTGATLAPGGLTQEGLRLRVSAGMSVSRVSDGQTKARSVQPFADILAGWQWQIGAVTLKALVGATGNVDFRPSDPDFAAGDVRVGPKAALEAWWSIDREHWASLDVAYAAPQTNLWSRVRHGTRVLPQLSLGAEAGVSGEAARPGGRVGAFARYEWDAGEIALAGGLARSGSISTGMGRDAGSESTGRSRYLTLLWLQRF